MLSTGHDLFDDTRICADLRNFLISLTPDRRIGLTLIDADRLKNGSIHELARTWLNEPERWRLDTFTFEKRRRQWLLGRVCAKQSVLNLISRTELAPVDIVIDTAANGRPFLTVRSTQAAGAAPDISISHSDHTIVALAANGRCGIDVQLLTDTLFKVRNRFCSEQENTLLHASIDDELPQMGLLWAAKEAVRKCFSEFKTIGFLAMKLARIDRHGSCMLLELQLDRPCTGIDTVTVAAAVENTACLAACIVPEAVDHA